MNEFENQSFMRRHGVWFVVLLALVIFGFLLSNGWDRVVNESVDRSSTITGNFSCLPLKDGTIPTENCTLGVKSKDGTYYALDISRIQDANTDLKAEDTIAVTGFLQPESQVAGSEWAMYNVKGIIKVNTLLRTR